MARYGTKLTARGIEKLTQAQMTSNKLQITHLAVGDANGAYYTPTGAETALRKEVWRGAINKSEIDTAEANRIVVEGVVPASAGGFTIREVALYDADGDMIAVGNYPESPKTTAADGTATELIIRTVIRVDNVDNVDVTLDPNVVMANVKYVNEEIAVVTTQLAQNEELNATMIISKQKPRKHNAFTSVVYNHFTKKYHAVYRGGEAHVETTGEIYYTESLDGKVWTEASVIINTALDDRDPSIAVLHNGTMIVNFFVYDAGKGTVYTSKSTDGQTWSTPARINTELYEFCSAPIVQLSNNNLLLPVYGSGLLKFYVSYDLGDTWTYLSRVPSGAGNPSEHEIFVEDANNLLCIIRSDAAENSPIYYSRSSNKGVSWSAPVATVALGKPSGVISDGQYLYVGSRLLHKYVYYGESLIYKFDLATMGLVGRYVIDTSYDYDNAYFGFASKDGKELIITYYSKLLNSESEVKLLHTSFKIFEHGHKILNAEHHLNSHVKPYFLSDNNAGHPVITFAQEHATGQFVRLVNEEGEVLGLVTKNVAKTLILNNPNGALHLAQDGGVVYLGNGAGEINTTGALVWRKNQDLRGITSMHDARVPRINGDTSSGMVYVQRLDVATTANRPTGVTVGYQVWDTTLKRPILWDGTTWMDKLGKFVSVPTSKTATGTMGDFSADDNYFYICKATNRWERIAFDTSW